MAQEAIDCPGRRHSRMVAHLCSLLGTSVDDDEGCSLLTTSSFHFPELAREQGAAVEEKQRTTTPVPNLVRTASPGATFMVAMVHGLVRFCACVRGASEERRCTGRWRA